MKKALLLVLLFLFFVDVFAQLEVKKDSFKEVPGFVNINPDQNYQTDDNDLLFAVIKVRTENITDKQRRELSFEGNGGTFIVLKNLRMLIMSWLSLSQLRYRNLIWRM